MKHPSKHLATAILYMLALAGCGDSNASENTPASLEKAASTKPESGSANAGPGKLKCPAKIAKGLPGPDIIGLKLGMGREEAVNLVRCHAKDAYFVFEDNWFERRTFDPHEMKLENQAFIAQTGENAPCNYSSFQSMQKCGLGQRDWSFVSEKIKVATPGLPGEEQVVGVWRTQSFREGEMPAVESAIAALTKKYGPFQRRREKAVNNNLWSDRIDLSWVIDSAGAPLSEANPVFNQCTGNVKARVDEGQVWRDGCGMSISVTILAPRNNPDVVGELSVGMMNQGDLYAYQEALQLKLDDIETARRNEELERAKSGGIDL